MASYIARFICNENEWKEFQKNAKEMGFLSGSECLRSRVREVNNFVRKTQVSS